MSKEKKSNRTLTALRTYFSVLVILGTFLWSVIAILKSRAAASPPDTVTIRIAHWQLEAGVRKGLEEMAEEYRKIHPQLKVQIVQDAIPEGTYGQWVSTQLMGGTAPDLIEIGMGLPSNIWLSYLNRYFVPLTKYVNQPNPYNKGTNLEGVPLRATIEDGMKSVYKEELQEYTGFSFSQFGIRVFYNKDLLKKLTGMDHAPKNFREFQAACDQIATQKNEKGQPYIPIAGSKYHLPMWEIFMCDLLTYPAINKIDFNRDWAVGNDEMFVAIKTGRIKFDNPVYQARFKLLREITNYFQSGWTGLGRDEAVFLFAQKRAVFISTGTWDAMSLKDQAEGSFHIGVMDFPLPAKDDPEYGQFIKGPQYEIPSVGFQFGLTRTSKHPEVALDFMFFMMSQKYNEQLNKIIGWIPGTKGTKMDPLLQGFKPHFDGVYPAFSSQSTFNLGGETWIKWLQDYSLFQVKKISFDELVKRFIPFYMEKGYKDFMEQQRDWRRAIVTNEQFLAGIRAKAMDARGNDAVSWWTKYTTQTANRQVTPEIVHNFGLNLLEHGPDLQAVGPYEYSPQVLEKIRQRVQKN